MPIFTSPNVEANAREALSLWENHREGTILVNREGAYAVVDYWRHHCACAICAANWAQTSPEEIEALLQGE